MVAVGNLEVKPSHSAVNPKAANKLKICTVAYFAMTDPVMDTFRHLLEGKLWNFYFQKAGIVSYLKQQQPKQKHTHTKKSPKTQTRKT